jgi:hypothetical protein
MSLLPASGNEAALGRLERSVQDSYQVRECGAKSQGFLDHADGFSIDRRISAKASVEIACRIPHFCAHGMSGRKCYHVAHERRSNGSKTRVFAQSSGREPRKLLANGHSGRLMLQSLAGAESGQSFDSPAKWISLLQSLMSEHGGEHRFKERFLFLP